MAKENSIPISGLVFQKEFLLIAMELDQNNTFKTPEGMKVSGECTNVSEETVNMHGCFRTNSN